ncbi:MAG: hypothetical protein PF440_11565 [Thiomicrorhabdus sp.]|jgi:hypothetical protein|nr:hypothetical protein [Thiomicrorhabdus sp.]
MTKAEIKEIFHEVIDEQNAKKWPSEYDHYLHHRHFVDNCLAMNVERVENHQFVSEIRFNLKATKRSSYKAMLWLIGICAGLVWAYGAAKVKGWTP